MVVNDIQTILREGLPDAEVIIKSDDGTHFEAVVITDSFIDKKSLDRQKMVYAVLGSYITNGSIHALSLKTFTRQEWLDTCAN